MVCMNKVFAVVSIVSCLSIFLPKAKSIKCYSCYSHVGLECKSTIIEIDCKPQGQLIYDSCFTVSKLMDYLFIGIRHEEIRNCSVFSDCAFWETIMCYNPDGFVKNCSIHCCKGDLCNGMNKTMLNSTSTITHGNVKSSLAHSNVTSAPMIAHIASAVTQMDKSHFTRSSVISLITSIDVSNTIYHAEIPPTTSHTGTIVNRNKTSALSRAPLLRASSHAIYSGMRNVLSTTLEQSLMATTLLQRLSTSYQTLVSPASKFSSAIETASRVEAVYAGAEKISAQLVTVAILMLILFVVFKFA